MRDEVAGSSVLSRRGSRIAKVELLGNPVQGKAGCLYDNEREKLELLFESFKESKWSH